MSILGRFKKELKQMADTLQRLQMYNPQAISAIDKQLEALIKETNLKDNFKKKLGEARNSLNYALNNGSRLQGAADRGTLLTEVLRHCKKAAQSLGEAVSML